MSRQIKDQRLKYYEIGINIFNCWLSHMKHNGPIASIMLPIMTKISFLCHIIIHRTRTAWSD